MYPNSSLAGVKAYFTFDNKFPLKSTGKETHNDPGYANLITCTNPLWTYTIGFLLLHRII